MSISTVSDDIAYQIVGLLTPREATPLRATSHYLARITDDIHHPVDVRPDELEPMLLRIKDGGTIRLRGRYQLERDLVVRKSLRIIGEQQASLHLHRGARLIWCGVGVVTGVTFYRCKRNQACALYPDATICARGLGRLHMQRCDFRFGCPSLVTAAYGVHIDFGGKASLRNVRFFESPGPCIKLVGGLVDITRGVFVLPHVGPAILAVDGTVRVEACTSLQQGKALVWLTNGATINSSESISTKRLCGCFDGVFCL